jgi:hypothetical protein
MNPTSFKFDEKTTQLIDRLKESSHASSRTEVIRKALYLLELATKANNSHEKLIIKSEDGKTEKEIVMY